jgi:hypothetical protein
MVIGGIGCLTARREIKTTHGLTPWRLRAVSMKICSSIKTGNTTHRQNPTVKPSLNFYISKQFCNLPTERPPKRLSTKGHESHGLSVNTLERVMAYFKHSAGKCTALQTI